MSSILLCGAELLRDELRGTIIGREEHLHHSASTLEQALALALSVQPDLVVIDRDCPAALPLVEDLRREAATRHTSIVIAAHGDISDLELQLIQSGANAVIRLPAGPEWDERLSGLMRVPGRRATRVPVSLGLQGARAPFGQQWGSAANISETGMLVDLGVSLPIGAEVDVGFHLPGTVEPVEGVARVVREDAPGRYGVHFERIERDGLARIRAFVAAGSMPPRRLTATRRSLD